MKHIFLAAGLLLISMLSWGQENLVITDDDILNVLEASRNLQTLPDEPDKYTPSNTPIKVPTPTEMKQSMLNLFRYRFWNDRFLKEYKKMTDERRRAIIQALEESHFSSVEEYSRVFSLTALIVARLELEKNYIGYEHLDRSFLEQVQHIQDDIPQDSVEAVKRHYGPLADYFESLD